MRRTPCPTLGRVSRGRRVGGLLCIFVLLSASFGQLPLPPAECPVGSAAEVQALACRIASDSLVVDALGNYCGPIGLVARLSVHGQVVRCVFMTDHGLLGVIWALESEGEELSIRPKRVWLLDEAVAFEPNLRFADLPSLKFLLRVLSTTELAIGPSAVVISVTADRESGGSATP